MVLRVMAAALTFGLLVRAPAGGGRSRSIGAQEGKAGLPRQKPTGSHLIVRVCHPLSEWDAIDKEQQENAVREVGRVQAMGPSDGTGFNPN